jgi:hypothetical protein
MRRSIILALCLLFWGVELQGLTANKVWMVLTNYGRYRVFVNYTVPEIKEFRESYVEFAHKKEAEKFYFDLLRGADFYHPDASKRAFKNRDLKPEPW